MRQLSFIAILLWAWLARADSFAATFELYLDAVQRSETEKKEALEDELMDSWAKLSPVDKKAMAGRYARVLFLAIEPRWKSFQELRLGSIKTLKTDMSLKVRAQQELQRDWVAIVALKDPEQSVASLVRIGQSYTELAAAFRAVPPPRGLTGEQLDLFKSELENQCPPLEEKAAESFRAALDLAKERGISTEATRLADEQLARFRKTR